MRRRTSFFAFLFTSLLLCTLLTGCATAPVSDAPSPQLTYAELLDTVMQTSEGGIGDYLTWCGVWNVLDGCLWACGGWRDADDPQNDRDDLLVSASQENDDASCLQLTLPAAPWQPVEGQAVYQGVDAILQAPDGGTRLLVTHWLAQDVTVGEQVFIEYLDAQYDLCTLQADGALQVVTTLQFPEALHPDAESDWLVSLYPDSVVLAPDGSLWVAVMGQRSALGSGTVEDASGWLLQFAPDGSCASQTLLNEGDFYITYAGLLDDGSLLLYEFDNHSMVTSLLQVDIAAEGGPLLTRRRLPPEVLGNNAWAVVGQGGDGRPLLWNPNGLFALDTTLTTAERLLDWADYGLDPLDIHTLLALDGGRFLAVTGQGRLRFHRLQPMTPEMLAGRAVLTLGVGDGACEELNAAVRDYNFTAPDVYIQTVDYSDIAARAAGYDSGTAMLHDYILKNIAPDILALPNDIGTQNLISKGVFVDLAPWLDADSELKREDFVPGLLAACASGQTLPTIVPTYDLITAAGDSALLGEAPGWTWEEYAADCAAAPDLSAPFFPFGRETMLHWLVQFGGDSFLDHAAGQAHFDTPAFIDLLQASAAWPAEGQDMSAVDEREVFRQGQSLAFVHVFSDFSALPSLRYAFDGDFVLKGLPGEAGSGAAFTPRLQLGITRDCQDPDAAWAFLRTLLLPDFQNKLSNSLPLRLDALQQAAKEAATADELQKSLSFLRNDLGEEQLAVWQQTAAGDCQKLLTAISQTTSLFQYDGTIYDILVEEADAFYNGVRPAAEAAIIQNRVQTYLDEQG